MEIIMKHNLIITITITTSLITYLMVEGIVAPATRTLEGGCNQNQRYDC
jgi:hypothetical protein